MRVKDTTEICLGEIWIAGYEDLKLAPVIEKYLTFVTTFEVK